MKSVKKRIWRGEVCAGSEVLALTQLMDESDATAFLYIVNAEQDLYGMAHAIAFFGNGREVYTLPAWDCMPYDHMDPHPSRVARRIATMCALERKARQKACHDAQGKTRQYVVLISAASLLQRLTPLSFWQDKRFSLRQGEELETDRLQQFLHAYGYERCDIVKRHGDYAWRGGIIDMFPPTTPHPLRIDLLDSMVESMRFFDVERQRSLETCQRFALPPSREYGLDKEHCRLFRSRYRALEGGGLDGDMVYAHVSEGRHRVGLCHWLPLFFDKTSTLLDYLPEDVVIVTHDDGDDRLEGRYAMIQDYRRSREMIRGRKSKEAHDDEESLSGGRLLPLEPSSHALYMTPSTWEERASCLARCILSSFKVPEGQTGTNVHCRPIIDSKEQARPLHVLKACWHRAQQGNIPLLIIADSERHRQHVRAMLTSQQSHVDDDLPAITDVASYGAVGKEGIHIAQGQWRGSFISHALAVVTTRDLFGERTDSASSIRKAQAILYEKAPFPEDSLVVHKDYGIGRYQGIQALDIDGAPHDCLTILYAQGEQLFVPVENIAYLSRYGQKDDVPLDRLGHESWKRRAQRAKKHIYAMAHELVATEARRRMVRAPVMDVASSAYDEFCGHFPFTETDEQRKAFEDVLQDLSSGTPMERLLCGDTGFGKTEVALRAAFVATCAGYQVLVMAPTTLLARQHADVFSRRFHMFGIKCVMLSRFTSAKEIRLHKDAVARGDVSIVIGTHGVLHASLQFSQLGLVIIDEEQHFGVRQKETFKKTYPHIHTLSLSATPIPRTLSMALGGIRDISMMTTPPVDRLPVRCFCMPFDSFVIQKALLREHERGGRSFYVAPHIRDVERITPFLRQLVPQLRIAVAHGRETAARLEHMMGGFYDGDYDLLLSTSIIESGLDIPLANTLIVERANMFGMAQLYQLRGRVGRSHHQAWAYFTWHGRLSTDGARRRLHVLERLEDRGAGLTVAQSDLDIRGAGTLLGSKQSGHIREIGSELYQQMVQDAVKAMGRETSPKTSHTADYTIRINLGIPVCIPEDYIANMALRLGLYRRIGDLEDIHMLDDFILEMTDRFGKPPEVFHHFMEMVRLKHMCRPLSIEQLDAGPKGMTCRFHKNQCPYGDKLLAWALKEPSHVGVRPDQRFVVRADWHNTAQRIEGVKTYIGKIARYAQDETRLAER